MPQREGRHRDAGTFSYRSLKLGGARGLRGHKWSRKELAFKSVKLSPVVKPRVALKPITEGLEEYKATQLLQAFTAKPLKRKSASKALTAPAAIRAEPASTGTETPVIVPSAQPVVSKEIEDAHAAPAALPLVPSSPVEDKRVEEQSKDVVAAAEELPEPVKAIIKPLEQEAVSCVNPVSKDKKKSKAKEKKAAAVKPTEPPAPKKVASSSPPKAADTPRHSPALPARQISAANTTGNTSTKALVEAKMQVRLLTALAIMLQVDKLSMQQQAKVKEAELSAVKEQLVGANSRESQLRKQAAVEAESKTAELSAVKAQLTEANSREAQLRKQVAAETEARQAIEREVAGDHARRLLKDTKAELTQYQKLLGAADAERESLSSRIKDLETRTKELEREKKILAKRQKELLPFAVDQSQTLFEPHSPTARSTVIEPCTPLRGSLVDAAAFLRKDSVTQFTIGSQVVYDNGNPVSDDPNKFRCSIRATRAWLAYLAKNSPRGQKKAVVLQPAAIIYERPPWKPAGYC